MWIGSHSWLVDFILAAVCSWNAYIWNRVQKRITKINYLCVILLAYIGYNCVIDFFVGLSYENMLTLLTGDILYIIWFMSLFLLTRKVCLYDPQQKMRCALVMIVALGIVLIFADTDTLFLFLLCALLLKPLEEW